MQLNLGDRIRQLRKKEGWTQEALADALGVTGQAVSRWESNGTYPDMELIPSIANFFGISIDELFGYQNERAIKIDETARKINEMNRQNNGVDINIDECLQLAREAVAEFPENNTLTLCLASVLFNAGYVRHSEYHLIDSEGYDVYDVERHKKYAEWSEAIKLYEKLLGSLGEGEMRHRAVGELSQLYLNVGEHEKVVALAESAPPMHASREFMRIRACDGKERARAIGEALLQTVDKCADLMIAGVLAGENNITAEEKVECVKSAVGLFGCICADGDFGGYNAAISHMYLLLSLYLWAAGRHDETFDALDEALRLARRFESFCNNGTSYTSPILRLVRADKCAQPVSGAAAELPEVWPWWSVSEYSLYAAEIKADARWSEWVKRTRE